jgi:hypothetical protein
MTLIEKKKSSSCVRKERHGDDDSGLGCLQFAESIAAIVYSKCQKNNKKKKKQTKKNLIR